MHTMADQDTTTTAQADAPEPVADAAAEAAPEPSQPDYKAIAEAEKLRADAAEKAAADEAFKRREAERRANGGADRNDDGGQAEAQPQPITIDTLHRVLDERESAQQKKSQEAQALEIARKNTTSEVEAQAAFQTWRSRVAPTGNLEDDVLFAIGGVHARKIAGQSAEVRRAQASATGASDDAAQGHHDPAPAGETNLLTPQDASAIKASGYRWDGAKRLYVKPLTKDGKTILTYDPKSKRTQKVALG